MYPPQCFHCNRFVKVATARQIPEYGDYGALLNVEFECERCRQKNRKPLPLGDRRWWMSPIEHEHEWSPVAVFIEEVYDYDA